MDQTAQSNQAEIANYALQLKKEQIAAYFQSSQRLIRANQLNEELINHQLAKNQQQIDLKFNQHSNQNSLNRLSPAHQQLITEMILNEQTDKMKSDFNRIFNHLYLNSASKIINESTQLKEPNNLNNLNNLNKFNDDHNLTTANPTITHQPHPTSAFRPVRRKDSIYCLNSSDSKRLSNDQQIMNLFNKRFDDTSHNNDLNHKIKIPKKSFTARMSPNELEQFNNSINNNSSTLNASITHPTKSYTPTRHISLDQTRNNFMISNQFQLDKQNFSSPFNRSSNSPLNNSSSYLNIKDCNQPLDMTKSSQLKNDLNESLAKKTKCTKDDIGQYINKIISENKAIVESNEPKLLKRNSSRNSTSNLPSNLQQFKASSLSSAQTTSASASKNHLQPHRMNRSISVIQAPYQLQRSYNELISNERVNHESPKLMCALRGQLENSSSSTSPNLNETQNKKSNILLPNPLDNNALYSLYQNNQFNRKLSDGNYLYASKQQPENSLDNSSFMKNFLSSSIKAPTIKVTPPCSREEDSSSSCLDNSKNNSSIIKDLLLVNKDGSLQQSKSENDSVQKEVQIKDDFKVHDQEELSCLFYVCTICKIAFRNEETLIAHQTHYCKNNMSTVISKDELNSGDNRLYNRSKETLDNNILKQHLLHPNQNLIKKRKISEPTFPSNSSLTNYGLFSKELPSSFKATTSSFLNELSKHNDSLNVPKNNAVFFSNFGLDAQQNVARKISVLHQANRPYFMNIKQPVFDHEHLIDLRQIPGLPAQLNSQHFNQTESNVLKSDHNNSITNLTDLQSTYHTQPSVIPISALTDFSSAKQSNDQDKVSNKTKINSSHHKYIDQKKDYTLISEYLQHYDRKITVRGQIEFKILEDTLDKEGDKAEFEKSKDKVEDKSVNSGKYLISNNQIKQTSSMPLFMSEKSSFSNTNRTDGISTASCTSLSTVANISTSALTTSISTSVSSTAYLPDLSTSIDNNTNESKKTTTESTADSVKDDEKTDKSNINDQTERSSPKLTTNDKEIKLNKRPANLFDCLLKKPCQLICSNLDSPETPRSEKTFVQRYLDGQLYTYLAPKRSTRVTFCCIYRPIPIFVEQSIEPKLSMYSVWQTQPPYDSILNEHKAPVIMRCYDSRQWKHHSSYYTSKFAIPNQLIKINRKNDTDKKEDDLKKEIIDTTSKQSLHEAYLENLKQIDDRNGCIMVAAFNFMMKKLKQDKLNIKIKLREFKKKFCEESSDLSERLKRRRKISRKISEDQTVNHQDVVKQLSRKQSNTNQPKRIYIFEGGYKSNENYTYVRGRGRGKYVCAECGIRCKKPSMLRKHIRTHTDLRPYSCIHCNFAFKTKGNLQKHMKSASHHKKCGELGISPIPTTIDTNTQIDTKALALQEEMERRASNQQSCLNDLDYDEDDLLDDEMDDDFIDDEALDARYGVDEESGEEEEDEEYVRRLENGIDQHLHITGLRIISNDFCLNKNDPFTSSDTSKSYLGVSIGCLTNFKRLSTFNDIILPNSIELNAKGNDKLNKFSIILEVINSLKITNLQSTSLDTNKPITSEKNSLNCKKLSLVDSRSPASRLANQQQTSETTSLEVIKPANDNLNNSSNLITALDSNNNLITLGTFNRARLAEDSSTTGNTIRHKHSLIISGVNSNSLASIPECLEELENQRKDDNERIDKSSDLDGNFKIIRKDCQDDRSMTRTPDLKRNLQSIDDYSSDREDEEQRKKPKNDDKLSDESVIKSTGDCKKDWKAEKVREEKANIVDALLLNKITDKNDDKITSTNSVNSKMMITSKNVSINSIINETDLSKCILNQTTNSNTLTKSTTLTTAGKKRYVREEEEKESKSVYHQTANKTNVGGVEDKLIKFNESQKRINSNENLTKIDQVYKFSFSDNNPKSYLSQLGRDSVPKENLDYKQTVISSRSKSLPPATLGSNANEQNSLEEEQSRSSSVNGNMKVSEIDEQIVAHSLLSLSRNWATDSIYGKCNQLNHQITLPIKRKISQEFGGVKFHHGNYENIRTRSPIKSPLTTYSDEEVSRAFKRNNIKLEHNWSVENWQSNNKSKTASKNDDKTNSRSNDETNIKLSDKLAKIKSLDPIDLTKRQDSNADIQKLLKNMNKNEKELSLNLLNDKNNELDKKKLILIRIQNKIDENERILNDGPPLAVNSTSSSTSSNVIKSPVDQSRTNVCNICNKAFSEESQLRLHENIHFFERPFRCEICGVSFRASGILQKHIRSAAHQDKLNKISTFGQPSPDNPRPFCCMDCKIRFRIFGHLSKHLRSKMHINKLESIGKLPVGLYALMERNRIQLNDLDTKDCESNLDCLRKLAQRLQANGDLPVSSTLNADTFSTTTSQSFCSSAYCESSNEDSNLSSGKSIDDKNVLNPHSSCYLNENSSSNPPLSMQNIQFTNDLYSKIIKTTLSNQLASSSMVVNSPAIPLFNTVLPIDPQIKQVNLLPNYLIDSFGVFRSQFPPQQQFYDQNSCKHQHHLFATNKQNIDQLPHGHPFPKANDKPDSPEINIEDSNESSRSSLKLDEEKKIVEKEDKNDALNQNDKVPKQSSPVSPSLSKVTANRSSSPNFASIQLNSNTCSICNQVFKSVKFLQVHLYSEHQNKPAETKKSKEEDNSPKAEKAKSNEFECKICGEVLNDLDQFRAHFLIHSTPRPYICNICDAGFSTRELLSSHSKTHN